MQRFGNLLYQAISMPFRNCLFAVLLSCIGLSSLAQNDSSFLDKASQKLFDYNSNYPVEKVYLQLDKPYYAAGDNLWFKAYVTAGRHKLSGISTVLNVELLNNKNKVEQYIKLPLVSGLTWGDFKLSDTLTAGTYRICAYTNWMRNAGSEYFFDRQIEIINVSPGNTVAKNTNKKPAKNERKVAGANTLPPIDVQFFPESGNLVYGARSKVAFKATGRDGLGKAIKGTIRDDQGKELISFNTAHLGMGSFDLFPETGRKYSAHINYPDGSENTVSLPVPLTTGYVMHVIADSLNFRLQIEACREQTEANINTGIYLVAQSGGEIFYAAGTKTTNSVFTAVVPKSKFPSGIVQFTLFSATGEPLCERLAFVQNPDQLAITISPAQKDFVSRGKVAIKLNVSSKDGKPALGNFSAAVINESEVPVDENNEPTILSHLLLTSDLKGYIEQPGYYFTNVNDQKRADLDLLMLTQGYRRFEWKQVLAGNQPPVLYQPERSLQIAGNVKTLHDKPLPGAKVSVLNNLEGFFLTDTLSDKNGHFVFNNLQYKDSTRFIVQSRAGKDSQVEIDSTINSPVVPVNRRRVEDTTWKDSLATFRATAKLAYDQQVKLGLNNHVNALHEVKITAKKPVLEYSANLNGAGQADQVLLAKDFPKGCPFIASCLGAKLTGVHFDYDEYGVGRPATYFEGHSVLMKIMVDGIEVKADILNTLPPEIVESVEVLRSGAFTSLYGSIAHNGLILINTKRGSGNWDKPKNILTYVARGYYKARVFYSPKYDTPDAGKQLPDLRNTIYWNPNIPTDKNGKATIDYFNADAPGTYRVIIQGIDVDGNLGCSVYRYKVSVN